MPELITRNLEMNWAKPQTKRIDSECYVEGYALTFDPYQLYEFSDGTKVMERIDSDAFNGCDRDDVILQFDHEGPVYARTSNNSLGMEVDEHGLLIWADLSRTARARQLYEDIEAGMVTKMSFRAACEMDFDEDTYTNKITKIKRLYDVSAVSFPANEGTELAARSMVDAAKEAAARAAEIKRKKLSLLLKLKGA